jgi:hypothetical protein
MITAK